MAEKLLELIAQVQDCGADVTDVVEMIWVENQTLVDHLIANGVEIPVRCEECMHRGMDGWFCGGCGQMPPHKTYPNSWCSYGEREETECTKN